MLRYFLIALAVLIILTLALVFGAVVLIAYPFLIIGLYVFCLNDFIYANIFWRPEKEIEMCHRRRFGG